MSLKRLPRVALLAWLCWTAGLSAALVPVPRLVNRVTDLTGTLTPGQVAHVEEELQAFEAVKGSQLVVLIIPSTGEEAIEQFGIRVADQWKIGRKRVDDGVILLVAKNDRTLRIEVGRGLEGVLPDATASRIIREIIVPCFKSGDFSGGIQAGVARIIKVIQGEPLPPPDMTTNQEDGFGTLLYMASFLGVPMVASFLGSIIGALLAGLLGGAVMGLLTYWVIGSWGGGLAAGLIFFGVCTGAASSARRRVGKGGSWSGGSSGSSSSGGSFSGGGGSFGGGGASGSW